MVCIGQGFFKEVAVFNVYSLTRPALGLGHLGLGPILEKRPSNVVGVGMGVGIRDLLLLLLFFFWEDYHYYFKCGLYIFFFYHKNVQNLSDALCIVTQLGHFLFRFQQKYLEVKFFYLQLSIYQFYFIFLRKNWVMVKLLQILLHIGLANWCVTNHNK